MSQPIDVSAINVATILDRGTRRFGEREAIVWGTERLTYAALDEQTRRICATLQERGIERHGRVALLGRNSVSYAVALLAVLRGGFVAVPLNWRLAPDALISTATKFAPAALLHADEFTAISEEMRMRVQSLQLGLSLDEAAQFAPGEDAMRAAAAAAPPGRDEVCAIISTGGTEGTPKGVTITHGSIEACVINGLCSEHPCETDIQLVLPQMFHNPQLYLVPWLLVGAKLVIPQMASFDPDLLLRTIAEEGVTHFLGVATMMTYLREAQERMHADLTSLKTIAYGGAPFAPATLERLMGTFGCDFLGMYGQTEASVMISVLGPEDHRAALADENLRHRLGSAGRPVALMDVRVVDDEGRDCPRDRATVGEIVARGPSVMHSYWQAPELTAAKIRDGWCWTGDLATWDEDGYLYIVDRRNDMIISGGENVFAKAVETVIYEHPAIDEVAVIGVPDPEWGEIVTAVLVAKPGSAVTEDEIASLCAGRLARYMRPRRMHFVDALPKNPSGKILKPEIRGWYREGSDADGGLARH